MKVFISWSGELSRQIAIILRDWIPSVIQSAEPFLSSEDITKGTRWNSELAQELNQTKFGIICLTKDNINSPWLNFESGALSKTLDNTYVAPFLFNIKPSELNSPLSQFQATNFIKEDIKKLVSTLNTAMENILTAERLNDAFEIWYPKLEDKLNELNKNSGLDKQGETGKINILEEILESTRNTQRLLGNSDFKISNSFEQMQKSLENVARSEYEKSRSCQLKEPMIDEIYHLVRKQEPFDHNYLLIILSFFRNDYPWIYESGKDLVTLIKRKSLYKRRPKKLEDFKNLVDITFEYPLIRDIFDNKNFAFYRELSRMFLHLSDKLLREGQLI